ncbi:hypothetical protein [Sphingomonas sp. CROZ-RG-20F-R02-07]|uniref:hypothetical protein n=1 Tax=Sphingomonas sp. CROZ-RG-20F-R02-07 TaxID=2914832 RepID=UPI001F5A33FB|nr:hypothetical protein [Sphingomonas sp. CROZ-RG-20F-R02-07]
MNGSDRDHHLRRAQQELERVRSAASECARRAHLELAQRYTLLVRSYGETTLYGNPPNSRSDAV